MDRKGYDGMETRKIGGEGECERSVEKYSESDSDSERGWN